MAKTKHHKKHLLYGSEYLWLVFRIALCIESQYSIFAWRFLIFFHIWFGNRCKYISCIVCALLNVHYMFNRTTKSIHFSHFDMKNMVISQVICYYPGTILQKNDICEPRKVTYFSVNVIILRAPFFPVSLCWGATYVNTIKSPQMSKWFNLIHCGQVNWIPLKCLSRSCLCVTGC